MLSFIVFERNSKRNYIEKKNSDIPSEIKYTEARRQSTYTSNKHN